MQPVISFKVMSDKMFQTVMTVFFFKISYLDDMFQIAMIIEGNISITMIKKEEFEYSDVR